MSLGRLGDRFNVEFSWEAQSSAGCELRNQDFLAEQDAKPRETSRDGWTVGLSDRLQEGQEENQRIPIVREACITLTCISQQLSHKT